MTLIKADRNDGTDGNGGGDEGVNKWLNGFQWKTKIFVLFYSKYGYFLSKCFFSTEHDPGLTVQLVLIQ